MATPGASDDALNGATPSSDPAPSSPERRAPSQRKGYREPRPISPWRRSIDARVSTLAEAGVHGLLRHWLALVNIGFALFVGLAFLPPVLMALGFNGPALWLYQAYEVTCHQWAFRSFFLFGEQAAYPLETLRGLVGDGNVFTYIGDPRLGYKVAFCQRDVAIFGAMLLGGIAFGGIRPRLRPPPIWLFSLLLVPIAADGFTQLFMLRESTWELRSITGTLFGLASVWLIYPQLDRSASRARRSMGLE